MTEHVPTFDDPLCINVVLKVWKPAPAPVTIKGRAKTVVVPELVDDTLRPSRFARLRDVFRAIAKIQLANEDRPSNCAAPFSTATQVS